MKENNNQHGGPRKGAGRPKKSDKALQVTIYVPATVVASKGGVDNLKKILLKFVGL